MNFYTRFSRLAIVNILSNLMTPLASFLDVAFLGHLTEIRHLAGVALATVLFNYLYWTFGFLRMGTTGMTAQAVGRNDRYGILTIGLRNLILALSIGLLIWVLQFPLREIGFTLLSATPEVKLAGRDYFQTMIWGAPANLMSFVLLGWFLGREQGSKVFLLSLVGNGSNVALNYWFIVQLGWASMGAGAATATSQYVMVLVGLGLILWEKPWQGVSWQNITAPLWERQALGEVFTLNGDILIRTFALITAFSLFTNFSSALGTVILAANTLLLQVITLAAYFIDGIAFATESLAGNLHGQKDKKGLPRLLWLSGSVSVVLGLMFAGGFILFPQFFFGLLTRHDEVIARVGDYILWLLPVLGFGGVAYSLDGYFLGLTAGRTLRVAMVISTGVGFLPLALVAWWWQSPQLLWLALTGLMVVRCVTLGWVVPRTF
ncbi:guanitoxin biosynthesis MATE family efflux transporter GntT [Spirulina sp. CS-785/01]|uniref:guanitoxin biosynthesis MATE family efflux transporter GntT n=1 Tax=Spirulina sp. CS-785/01 TaxID=3021716 RepID=UPI00232EE530|nr:guanitoxin biosynthesis MATE family efflux transporter GntT [Spirulina sp. CS-785/01]MDB9315959.1 guanitoxin biosynthesis MATE family efflux transporter GntT [Spirulina sp. CS-785/01]